MDEYPSQCARVVIGGPDGRDPEMLTDTWGLKRGFNAIHNKKTGKWMLEFPEDTLGLHFPSFGMLLRVYEFLMSFDERRDD